MRRINQSLRKGWRGQFVLIIYKTVVVIPCLTNIERVNLIVFGNHNLSFSQSDSYLYQEVGLEIPLHYKYPENRLIEAFCNVQLSVWVYHMETQRNDF